MKLTNFPFFRCFLPFQLIELSFLFLPHGLLPRQRLHSEFICLALNMASSQRDMFLPSSPESDSSSHMNSSLPNPLIYEYLWVILFEWNLNQEQPFQIFQIAGLRNDELNPEWIKGDLDECSRLKKLSFPSIGKKQFSLFAKVEKCELKKETGYLFFIINLSLLKLFN